MRLAATVLSGVLFLDGVVGGARVSAQESIEASRLCPALVADVLAVDASGQAGARGPATTYGLVLRGRRRTAARRYDVYLRSDERLYRVGLTTPITEPTANGELGFDSPALYVRFARPVAVHDVWIGRIVDGDAEGVCSVNNVNTDRFGPPRVFPPVASDRLGTRIMAGFEHASPTSVDETTSLAVPTVACPQPDLRGGALTRVDPSRFLDTGNGTVGDPSADTLQEGDVVIVVSIDGDGRVVDTRVQRSAVGPRATRAALLSARYTVFRAPVIRCQRTPSDITLTIQWKVERVRG